MARKPSSFAKRFIAEPGKPFSLAKIDPRDDSAFNDKDEAKERTQEDAEAINVLQDRLFAEGKRALLVVLQGIDCSGKDGTVRAVFNICGPIGVTVIASLPRMATSVRRASSRVSSGSTRQLTTAVAVCGSALLACPASSRVATHVVLMREL